MGKPYINNAVIGNGSMLGCITETGELIRLYWPEIDYSQHIEKMLTGFFSINDHTGTIWFSAVSYTHLDVYKRQEKDRLPFSDRHFYVLIN